MAPGPWWNSRSYFGEGWTQWMSDVPVDAIPGRWQCADAVHTARETPPRGKQSNRPANDVP